MIPKHRKPTSPGEILWEEFLKPMGISQSNFVRHLGGTWTQPKLSAIIRGTRAITEAIALDFADALGTSSEFWINLQNDVNLWKAMQHRKKIRRFPKNRTSKSRAIRSRPKSRTICN